MAAAATESGARSGASTRSKEDARGSVALPLPAWGDRGEIAHQRGLSVALPLPAWGVAERMRLRGGTSACTMRVEVGVE